MTPSVSPAGGESTPVAASPGGPVVTLVAGTTFLVCAPSGDVMPECTQGFYADDTRLLDRAVLSIDDLALTLLESSQEGSSRLRSLTLAGDPVSGTLLVTRTLDLGTDLVQRIEVEDLTGVDRMVTVDLRLGADFADVFDVKRGDPPRAGFVGSGPVGRGLRLTYERGTFRRELRCWADQPGAVLRDGLTFSAPLAARGHWAVTVTARSGHDGHPAARHKAASVDREAWRSRLPRLRSDVPHLQAAWEQSTRDLGSLILPGLRADRPIVAAGSPWFMALFGRDSLITGWQSLLLDPSLVLGCLEALAARQGRMDDPRTEEAPGRILHEVRAGQEVQQADSWGATYYGSVDATPLFVMALVEAWRWGAPEAEIRALAPAAERAVGWIAEASAATGFLTYGEAAAVGGAHLANEGWKDSVDALRRPDGTLADGPIALVEVQGYCHAALCGLADLRAALGTGDPAPLRAWADRLAAHVERAFWVREEGTYALALDGRGAQVAAVASNAGHLLWTGTARPDRASWVAGRLLAPDSFTGWGVRTLTSANPGFNPLSYHCGTVWPHDNSLVAAGMLRYGLAEGGRLALALLEAAGAFGSRLPELFGGFDRARFDPPLPYPTSCSPQAWAAGAPVLLVRSLLGLDPDVPSGVVRLRPRLPPGCYLQVEGVPLAGGHLSVRAEGGSAEVLDLPDGLRAAVS